MIVHDFEQGSPEWFAARRGIATASEFSKILTATGKPSTSSQTYLYTLVAERLAGQDVDTYTNEWMERGKEMEAEARDLFTMLHDKEYPPIGFITDDDHTIGCSPDGWDGTGGLEIKCPKASTHVKYLLSGGCPTEYVPQVQGSMYVTGATEWWFMSYYPGLDPLIVQVQADIDWHKSFAVEIAKFNKKLAAALAQLRKAA